MRKIRVLIKPKEGLLDPQGRAVEEMLKERGVELKNLKVGKLVEFEVDSSREDIRSIVERYIINPLIEEYEIEEVR
ncbi:MAG TPA: phosphoribosylformylglycinamidine synthase subunit PurS [Aquificaceae bacterium]|nr:phosphoribosylformylglycinamidine synthase subunit PurS [Aquificaceae bacterium]HIQ31321.1 phosphoribosylformylglycinamidine synthase, purS protein [Aquifex aeolicus]